MSGVRIDSLYLINNLCLAAIFLMALANLLDQFYTRNFAQERGLRDMRSRLNGLDLDHALRPPSPPSRWDHLRERYHWLPSALWVWYSPMSRQLVRQLTLMEQAA